MAGRFFGWDVENYRDRRQQEVHQKMNVMHVVKLDVTTFLKYPLTLSSHSAFSHSGLLKWLNDFFELDFKKIEECATGSFVQIAPTYPCPCAPLNSCHLLVGAIHCQVLDAIFPGL